MTYANDPAQLARLLNDLADALKAAGIDASGASHGKHLIDEAHKAACELDPPKPRAKKARAVGFP
ncbi:hypothetical protein ACWF94_24835 [Streptomyces sp. NPDC055078]